MYNLTFIVVPQPEGGYTVTCEELPELVTEGDDIIEVKNNIVDALCAVVDLYDIKGRPLPKVIIRDLVRTTNATAHAIS